MSDTRKDKPESWYGSTEGYDCGKRYTVAVQLGSPHDIVLYETNDLSKARTHFNDLKKDMETPCFWYIRLHDHRTELDELLFQFPD